MTETFPNIRALADGCVSTDLDNWPVLKAEASAVLEENKRLENTIDLNDKWAAEMVTKCEKLEEDNKRLKASNNLIRDTRDTALTRAEKAEACIVVVLSEIDTVRVVGDHYLDGILARLEKALRQVVKPECIQNDEKPWTDLAKMVKDLLDYYPLMPEAYRNAIHTLLEELANERAVCICGCPVDQHENYGEDGESCEVKEHQCLRVCVAVRNLLYAEMRRRRVAEGENKRLQAKLDESEQRLIAREEETDELIKQAETRVEAALARIRGIRAYTVHIISRDIALGQIEEALLQKEGS